MTYTDEQFNALAQWEDVLSRAVRGAYLRSPGIEALHSIHAIYTTATGSRLRFSGSCGLCARNILRLAGKAYLADKAEREEAAKAPAPPVAEVTETAEAPASKKKAAPKKKTTK